MFVLDLGASEYWSRVGSVSGRYPEPPLLIRRALDEDTLPVRDAHGLHVLSISILFHANLVSFTTLLAKAGATGAETQVLRGMDFFVWCLGGTECFGRMALIEELQLGTCSPSSLQLIPSPWPEMRYQFITCTGMRSAPQTGGNCTFPTIRRVLLVHWEAERWKVLAKSQHLRPWSLQAKVSQLIQVLNKSFDKASISCFFFSRILCTLGHTQLKLPPNPKELTHHIHHGVQPNLPCIKQPKKKTSLSNGRGIPIQTFQDGPEPLQQVPTGERKTPWLCHRLLSKRTFFDHSFIIVTVWSFTVLKSFPNGDFCSAFSCSLWLWREGLIQRCHGLLSICEPQGWLWPRWLEKPAISQWNRQELLMKQTKSV